MENNNYYNNEKFLFLQMNPLVNLADDATGNLEL